MNTSSQSSEWPSYEAKAASLVFERRIENLRLENLRVRLQKKMKSPEQVQAPEPASA